MERIRDSCGLAFRVCQYAWYGRQMWSYGKTWSV